MTGPAVYLCRTCNRLLPLDDDHFYRRKDRGRPRFVRPCKECRKRLRREEYARNRTNPTWIAQRRKRQAESHRRRRAEDAELAERERASSRAWKARQEASNPAWVAQTRATVRIDARLRAERLTGELPTPKLRPAQFDGYVPPVQTSRGSTPSGPMLDVGPLREWLAYEFAAWEFGDVARRCGVNEATVRRILAGDQRKVSLHIADRMFVGADCPHLLAILYPTGEAVAV